MDTLPTISTAPFTLTLLSRVVLPDTNKSLFMLRSCLTVKLLVIVLLSLERLLTDKSPSIFTFDEKITSLLNEFNKEGFLNVNTYQKVPVLIAVIA